MHVPPPSGRSDDVYIYSCLHNCLIYFDVHIVGTVSHSVSFDPCSASENHYFSLM